MSPRQLLPVLAIVLLAWCHPAVCQQSRAFGAFHAPSCAQSVRMGLDRTIKSYEKQGTLSEADYDQAYEHYYDCARAYNDRQAAPLSGPRRRQLNDIRTALEAMENDYIDLSSAVAGGGTMYNHFKNRACGYREEFMIALVRAVAHPRRAPGRRTTAAVFARIKARLVKLGTPPAGRMTVYTGADRAKVVKEYAAAHAALKRAVTRLETLDKALPVGAAWRLAHYMDKALVYPLD